MRKLSGFTGIVTLVTVVVVGLAAVVAIPRLPFVRHRSYAAEAKLVLEQLSAAQYDFFKKHDHFTDAVAALSPYGFEGDSDVVITIPEATLMGWSAKARHVKAPVECTVFFGDAAHPVSGGEEGVPHCQGR